MNERQLNPYIKDLLERIEAIDLDNPGLKTYLLPDRFHCCLIGHTNEGNAVYDYSTIIATLIEEEDMSLEEAAEYVDFNILHVYLEKEVLHPIIVFS